MKNVSLDANTPVFALAQMYAAYYLQLCEHGLAPEMAIQLVRDLQRIQFESVFAQMRERDAEAWQHAAQEIKQNGNG